MHESLKNVHSIHPKVLGSRLGQLSWLYMEFTQVWPTHPKVILMSHTCVVLSPRDAMQNVMCFLSVKLGNGGGMSLPGLGHLMWQ